MNASELANRYAAGWNEPDETTRRQLVRELWAEDAVHILRPPEQLREVAAGLSVGATFQVRGHDELEARVKRAYEQFVIADGNSFRAAGDAARLSEVAKFRWEMVASNGDITGGGLEFVILDSDGRIKTDYQFIG